MSLLAYSEYKPSDAAWLGDIPKHWSLEPLRGQFEELKDKNVGALDQNYLSLVAGRGVMPYAEKGEMGNKKPDDLEKCKLVKAGNFVINSMNFGIGAFGVSAHDGVCSPVYVVLEPSEPRSLRYLRWIFDNPGFREVAQSFGNGILAHRAAIGWDDLKLMKIGVPPIEEQEAIATFLDRETAKIDALVAEQERLIALLKEKRQAVISHAVTKGLDPDAPMKDSGIEWLGEIPAHWDLKPLRRITLDHRQGYYSADGYVDEGVKLLRITDLKGDGRIDLTDSPSVGLAEGLGPFFLANGDFVFARTGGAGSFALIEGLEEPAVYASYLIRFRFCSSVMPRMLLHFFESHVFQLGILQNIHGGVNQNVHAEDIKNQWLPLPPFEEQERIAEHLTLLVEDISQVIDEALRSISLLKERRAALISAAVTGKIDVRGLVERHETEAA